MIIPEPLLSSVGSTASGSMFPKSAVNIVPTEAALPYKALTFPTPIPKTIEGNRSSNIKDVANFVGTFMQYERTGQLTNLLLRLSDLPSYFLPADSEKARRSLWEPGCEKIGENLSQSVDFAKHGNTVSYEEVSKAAKFDLKRLPDFMAKETDENEQYGKYYVSNSLPGILYRCMNQADFDTSEFQNRKIQDLIAAGNIPAKFAPELDVSKVVEVDKDLSVVINNYRKALWVLFDKSALPGDLADDEVDLILFNMDSLRGRRQMAGDILDRLLGGQVKGFLDLLKTLATNRCTTLNTILGLAW